MAKPPPIFGDAMKVTPVVLVAAMSLISSNAFAQGGWGKVKSWTGTLTIEATDSSRTANSSVFMTYKATGPFTIADDMMGDGDHVMWPQPSIELMSDPTKLAAAYDTWQARVVATYAFKGVDETGAPVSQTCTADGPARGRVGVALSGASDYMLQVTAPDAAFKCSSPTTMYKPNVGAVRPSALSVTGAQGDPGKVTNTKTFKVRNTNIVVTFSMAPTK
ncbi:MAG TPA: hypothetical protein VJR92_09410 [Gemmatimonadaceae bacterium]|nr:hypothetical protein [Gemmatimonadaceae bacterium]